MINMHSGELFGETAAESSTLKGCSMEIHELMKQIDASVNAQKTEWQNKLKTANDKLSVREQELLLQKATLKQKNTEIAMLQKNVKNLERGHQRLTSYYHDQLMSFKDEIITMKNEHARLLKKYDIKHYSSHSKKEVHRLLSTVENCDSKISELEKERHILQKHFDTYEKEGRIEAGSIKLIESSRTKETKGRFESKKKESNSLSDLIHSAPGELGLSLDESRKLKSCINQLQAVIRQKDDYIQLLESNRNDNALIGCLETDLYSAKQEMKARIEKENAMRVKIKHLEKSLSQSNNQCKKLVDQIASIKENEDFVKCKQELADKDLQLLEMKKEIENLEDEWSHLEQNESNIKIELQVVTAQLNALKLENLNLRRIYISDMSPNNSDSMKYFQELQQAYYDSLRILEDKNRNLEMAVSKQQQQHMKVSARNWFRISSSSPAMSESSKQFICNKDSLENTLEKSEPKSKSSKKILRRISSNNNSSGSNSNNNNFISLSNSLSGPVNLEGLNDANGYSNDVDEISLSSRSSMSESQVSWIAGMTQDSHKR